MATSIRRQILELHRQGMDHIDRLDLLLADMKVRAGDRQPALDAYGPILIEAHEQLRSLWRSLRKEL